MPETTPSQKRINRLAQGISYGLHPLILPSLVFLLLLFGHSVMNSVSLEVKGFFMGTVVLNTLIIPLFSIALLKHFGFLGDYTLQSRRERLVPLVIVAVSYLLCILLLRDILTAFLIIKMLMASLGCVLFTLLVTPFWKVSLHMTALGGVIALISILDLSGFGVYPYTITLMILLAGALGSARLWLGYHNLLQIGVGFCAGFTIAGAVFLLS